MFGSLFFSRLKKYYTQPKNFVVNLEVQIGSKYFFVTKKIQSRFRSEAIEIAKEEILDDIKVIYKGSKSLGRIKQFNEV